MVNLIKNATALDDATDWTGTAVAADHATLGGPGRGVITATGTTLQSAAIPRAGATVVYAFAHHRPGRTITVESLNGSGESIGSVALPVVQSGDGDPRRGIPSTFAFSKGRVTLQGGAASYALKSSGPAGQALLKPYLGVGGYRCWTPGPHTNPDLNLAIWPDTLPDLRQIDSPRTPTRLGYQTDAQVPVGRRIATRGRIRFSGEMKLTLEQRDTLDVFLESRNTMEDSAPFWFVHPDTRQLTRAWFDPEDGDPQDSGAGGERRTRVGLLLEIA